MASKSKKRRRVLGASCILAALIIAGSSFAWFTSKDEVTNRLSASGDYDVSIVESFAPPKNWLPGEDINKDVYATNTGSIPAFVEETVTSTISITTEEKVAKTDVVIAAADFPKNSMTETMVTLNEDERYSVEAGSFLAFRPTGSTNELGRQVVTYKADEETKYRLKVSPYTVISAADWATKIAGSVPATLPGDKTAADYKENYEEFDASKATDFYPTSEGLYVFRRIIDVANDRSELFEYVGYYFKDGQYYKVTDIAVTPDTQIDLANDGVDTDGILAGVTSYNLAKDVKHVATPVLTYDSENNRLVATYGTTGTTYVMGDASTADSLKGKAKALDDAEHALADARAEMDRAFLDLGISNDKVKQYTDKAKQIQAELDKTNAKIAELTAAETPIDTQVSTLSGNASTSGSVAEAEQALKNALTALYGTAGTNGYTYTAPTFDGTTKTPASGSINFAEPTTVGYANHNVDASNDSKYNLYLTAKKALEDAKSNYGDSMFNAYKNEMAADNLVSNGYITTNMTYDQAIAKLTYKQLKDYTPSTEYHDIHALTVALLEAKEAYETAKDTANDKLSDLLNKSNLLGAIAGADTTTSNGGSVTIAGETIKWNTVTPKADQPGSGLYGEQNALQTELDTQRNKQAALVSAYNTAISDSTTTAVAPPEGATESTAQAEYDSCKANYQAKLEAYYTALNDYNNYKTNYETQDKALKIYINLGDVITTAGEANKWQMLPVPDTTTDPDYRFTNDTAVFYYTSILESGETSTKLIDSVELDKNTTNGMYKSFDFDLNVAMKSAQVNYADDGQTTIVPTAANSELDANASLYEPTNVNTAVAWTAKP